MDAYRLFHGGAALPSPLAEPPPHVPVSHQNTPLRFAPPKHKPAFTEPPVPVKLQPVKPSLPLGPVGFSQVGVLDRGLQRSEEAGVGELSKFVLKPRQRAGESLSEDEPLDNKASRRG